MFLFNHPQPALVFIVPFCTLSILMMNFKGQNKISVWNYSTNMMTSKKQQGVII